MENYKNVFNSEITDFTSTELLESHIVESCNKKLIQFDQNEEFYDT